MLQKYNQLEWKETQDLFVMRSFMDPNLLKILKSATNYHMEVTREGGMLD